MHLNTKCFNIIKKVILKIEMRSETRMGLLIMKR